MALNWIAYLCSGSVRHGTSPIVFLEEAARNSYSFDGDMLRYLEVRSSIDDASRLEIVVLGARPLRPTWVDDKKESPAPDEAVVCRPERRIFVTGFGLSAGGERRLSFGGRWIDACSAHGSLPRLQVLLRRDPY